MNIRDVAEKAGVSVATVSRVLNGSDNVKGETREKVLEAVENLDYTPNLLARGLRISSADMIGILCPDVADIFMASAISILEKSLHQLGFECLLGCSGYEQTNKEKYVKLMLSKRVNALILIGSSYVGQWNGNEVEYIREAAKKIPVFLINSFVDGDNIYCSYVEDFRATYEVASNYIKNGRKRILFLCDSHSFSANRKLEGYKAALTDAGYEIRDELIFYVRNDVRQVRDMLLEQETLQFDSVVATDDGLAVGAVKYALRKGLSIPEEVSVTGYNNTQLAMSCEPELSSMDGHLDQLCGNVIEAMEKIFRGEENVERKKTVTCTLIKRDTTDF